MRLPDVRQCILYDSPEPNARLIGVEYMISPRLYNTLDAEERKLWHSHVFEVKSGMLIMPQPKGIPDLVWEKAELKEMEEVVGIYGKIYHLWQVDKGDKLPLGPPQLMTSYTAENQFAFEKMVGERDKRFGSDYRRKREIRDYIQPPEIHPGRLGSCGSGTGETLTHLADADQAWKTSSFPDHQTSEQATEKFREHGGAATEAVQDVVKGR